MSFSFVLSLALAATLPTADSGSGQRVSEEVAQAGHQFETVRSRHVGTFAGVRVPYTTTVEAIDVTAATNGARARVVSFAYTRDDVDAAQRPVIFFFNGGPIVPSQYVHLGGFGPRRVVFPDDVKTDPSEFVLTDNPYSPLDVADLVFVDPASTGFSRVLPGSSPKDFYSVEDDAAQFVAFIKEWMTRHDRVGAPIFIFGESYGTNRAAEIANQMAGLAPGFLLQGVFLYGQAVNIIEYAQRPMNVTSYVVSMPTVAAIAWYHDRGERKGRTLEQFIVDADEFAKNEYLSALHLGSSLPDPRREYIAKRLEEFSGISSKWYIENDLKISKEEYRELLLKDEGLLLGRSDARYAAPIDERGRAPDPAIIVGNTIQEKFQEYLQNDLNVHWNMDYMQAAPLEGLDDWTWANSETPFSEYSYHLGISKLLQSNPSARIVVANSYFDTMTTLGAAELLVNQSDWDRDRVTLKFYDGGHMGYSIDAVAREMSDDIRVFVR